MIMGARVFFRKKFQGGQTNASRNRGGGGGGGGGA